MFHLFEQPIADTLVAKLDGVPLALDRVLKIHSPLDLDRCSGHPPVPNVMSQIDVYFFDVNCH
jgi:hypothetical protein